MEIIGGVILAESEIRIAALNVLINCVSVPEELAKVFLLDSSVLSSCNLDVVAFPACAIR